MSIVKPTIVEKWQKKNNFVFCSLTQLLLPTPTHCIFMNELGLKNLAQFREVSGCRMALMKTLSRITTFSKCLTLSSITEGGRIQLSPNAPCIYDQTIYKISL